VADRDTTVQELIEEVTRFQAERDWAKYHSPKNLAMGLAIETGELLEHFLWLTEEESRRVKEDPTAVAAVAEELSDVLTYLLNLALALKIDVSDAFRQKMRRNGEKYPAETYRGRYKVE
jgi:NTP pyrophosphatase (non-canonical NTP hydrolase)